MSHLVSECRSETIFDGLSSSSRNYFLGDPTWKPFISKNLKKFTEIDFDGNAFSLITENQKRHFETLEELIPSDKWDRIFVHVHEFDAQVHLDRLNTQNTYDALDDTQAGIVNILDQIDDNTTLIITSDHGMVEFGHGGFTDDERLGTFFAYSKNGFADVRSLQNSNPKSFRSVDVSNILNYYIGSTFNLNSFGHF